MKQSLKHKLSTLSHRFSEINALLSDPDIIAQQNKFRDLSKEYAQLEEVVKCFTHFEQNEKAILAAEHMLTENDAEMQALAQEELNTLKTSQADLETQLQLLLLPKDPNDDRNVFLEIRA